MLLAVFCLRLACGLLASLLVLPAAQVHPRFYRTHFLTALGLLTIAAVCLFQVEGLELSGAGFLWVLLGGEILLALAGSLLWSLEGAPGGRTLIVVTALMPIGVLYTLGHQGWLLADDVASAALLGTATTAMLVGHSYLIAPGRSLSPLYWSLGALGICTLARLCLALAGLWFWTAGHSLASLEGDLLWWLPARWALGFLGPLVLGWMAWETARIRSTQSATGILYVVVICCFLGELTSQLLLDRTRIPL
jgi:hypothetical protein